MNIKHIINMIMLFTTQFIMVKLGVKHNNACTGVVVIFNSSFKYVNLVSCKLAQKSILIVRKVMQCYSHKILHN